MRKTSVAISPARLLLVVGMMVTIFTVSAQPGDHLHLPKFLPFDKIWHMLEYGILAAVCFFAFHPIPARTRTSVALAVVCFAALYGISDEFHQSFVPLRTSSLSDIIADTLGAALVAGVWWWKAGSPRS